jgi:hypothetical protein
MPLGDDDLRKAIENGNFPEGITELGSAAATAHEIMTSHIEVGFSEAQALYIVACLLTGNPGKPPTS